jgi:hypothetical protein
MVLLLKVIDLESLPVSHPFNLTAGVKLIDRRLLQTRWSYQS